MPHELMFGLPSVEEAFSDTEEYAKILKNKIQLTYQFARDNMRLAVAHQRQAYTDKVITITHGECDDSSHSSWVIVFGYSHLEQLRAQKSYNVFGQDHGRYYGTVPELKIYPKHASHTNGLLEMLHLIKMEKFCKRLEFAYGPLLALNDL